MPADRRLPPLPSRRLARRPPAILAVAALAIGVCAPARADDLAYGEYLASECVTCHVTTGEKTGIPSIVGWPADRFVATLEAYRLKRRDNEVMQTIAGRLGAAEMQALAAYFASLGNKPAAPDKPDCGNRSEAQPASGQC